MLKVKTWLKVHFYNEDAWDYADLFRLLFLVLIICCIILGAPMLAILFIGTFL